MFFAPYKSGWLLCIKLTPNASFCGFRGVFINADDEEYLKAYINVAPEKGKANKALIVMLAKRLKTPKQAFSIISGETEHYKKIYIETTEDISSGLRCLSENEE